MGNTDACSASVTVMDAELGIGVSELTPSLVLADSHPTSTVGRCNNGSCDNYKYRRKHF